MSSPAAEDMPQLMCQGKIDTPVRGTLFPVLRNRLHNDDIAVHGRKVFRHGLKGGGQLVCFDDIQADEFLFADGIQQAEAVDGI